MVREQVRSSNIEEIGFDPLAQILEVKFKGNADIYQYAGVSRETHKALMAADSIGAYFSANIKSLPYTKVQWQGEASNV